MALPLKEIETEIRARLDYDPASGDITWKHRPGDPSFNSQFAGRAAGYTARTCIGYMSRHVKIMGRSYLAHRIAWLIMTGEEPPEQIDHINRDATDNRWENLRASDGVANARNRSRQSNNTSGFTGVYWSKAVSKWQASVKVGGRLHYLGVFADKEEAIATVSDFRKKHGFTEGHGVELPHYKTGAS